MPLCQYFLATDAELASVAKSTSNAAKLTRVDAKGFDVVPLDALAKRLKVRQATPPGEPEIHGDEFEWFAQRLTPAMLKGLAGLADADCRTHAKALIASGDVDWSEDALAKLLGELSSMARTATEKKRGLFMWMST